MIVNILNEQDSNRPFFLGEESFSQWTGVDARHQPVERAFPIFFAGLVVQDQDNLSLDFFFFVIVVGELGCADTKAHIDDRTLYAAAGAEAQGIVILPRLEANAGLFSGEDLEEIGSSLVMRLLDHLFALPGSEPTWQL